MKKEKTLTEYAREDYRKHNASLDEHEVRLHQRLDDFSTRLHFYSVFIGISGAVGGALIGAMLYALGSIYFQGEKRTTIESAPATPVVIVSPAPPKEIWE